MKNVNDKIAHVLKTLRREKAWSLDLTSQKTGVSKAMLGQIERGESSPTIATLWKIADGFEVSFSSFVEDLDPTPTYQQGNSQAIRLQDDKIRVMPLFAYDPTLKFEVFIIELLPGCEHLSLPHQSGVVEHVMVSNGEMEVYINGAWHRLKQNEGLRFQADQPHGYRNLNHRHAIFYNTIHYTKT